METIIKDQTTKAKVDGKATTIMVVDTRINGDTAIEAATTHPSIDSIEVVATSNVALDHAHSLIRIGTTSDTMTVRPTPITITTTTEPILIRILPLRHPIDRITIDHTAGIMLISIIVTTYDEASQLCLRLRGDQLPNKPLKKLQL